MAEMRQTTSNGPSNAHPGQSISTSAAGRSTLPSDPLLHGGERRSETAADTPVAQEMVAAWVRDNPMLALLGGIALGVFIGAWMRN